MTRAPSPESARPRRNAKAKPAVGPGKRTDLPRQDRLLAAQITLTEWQIAGERVGVALKVLTALIGLAVAFGIGFLVWDAKRQDGLVVEAFSVPPTLAAEGLTGEVIAAKVLDQLTQMDRSITSARAPKSFANDWIRDVRVQIPQTGVSVSELRQILVDWLGDETRISGEVYTTPEGLALSARTNTGFAETQVGDRSALEGLIKTAAQDIYAATQPYRYVTYLSQTEGPEASIARHRRAVLSGPAIERVWAYNGAAVDYLSMGDQFKARDAARQGLALEPKFSQLHRNLAQINWSLGFEAAALRDGDQAARTLRRYGKRYYSAAALKWMPGVIETYRARLRGDYRGAAEALERTEANGITPDAYDLFERARAYALAHDAEAAAATGREWPLRSDDLSLGPDTFTVASYYACSKYALRDWPGIVALIEIFDGRFGTAENSGWDLNDLVIAVSAYARTGRTGEARDLLDESPLDCQPCVRARGIFASATKDWPGADHWFGEAVRMAPDSPFAYAEWGESKAARGKPEEAYELFRQATMKGPKFADAYELWGEALLHEGDARRAAEKFRLANDFAPRWGRNHVVWGDALAKLGKMKEAREHWQTASRLRNKDGLSDADYQLVRQRLDRPA